MPTTDVSSAYAMLADRMVRDLIQTPAGMRAVVQAFAELEFRTEPEAIDAIARAEEVKAAGAAVQARATARLDELRREREAFNGVAEERRGKGLAEEVALARRESPWSGSRHLRLGQMLVADMPHTLAAMTRGEVSEQRAAVVARETQDLCAADRRTVDAELADVLPNLSDRSAGHRARRIAQRLDEESAAARLARNYCDRRVTFRAGRDGMGFVTAHLPVADAIRLHEAVMDQAAEHIAAGLAQERSAGQVAVDLLVERVTGKAATAPRAVALTLVMTDETLLGGKEPAWSPGHGPLSAHVARGLLTEDQAEVVELRRLWTEPATGRITKMDTRSRAFTPRLRALVLVRDDVCRTPFCGAPIKQVDHARRHADGGATALSNASGLCQRCNLAKERPGWMHEATDTALTVRTPTGHTYEAAESELAAISRAQARGRSGTTEDPA